MFTFEDLGKIDDQSMQLLIREVEKDKWVMSMRTASPNLKKRFGNMSNGPAPCSKKRLSPWARCACAMSKPLNVKSLIWRAGSKKRGQDLSDAGKTKDILV
jgi:hypothetical protein